VLEKKMRILLEGTITVVVMMSKGPEREPKDFINMYGELLLKVFFFFFFLSFFFFFTLYSGRISLGVYLFQHL
jgi:hypothetical protein